MKKIILLFFSLMASIAFADDIIFLSGCEIINVNVLEETETSLTLITSDKERITINYPGKYSITKSAIIENEPSTAKGSCARFVSDKFKYVGTDYKTKVDYQMLIIGLGFSALAIDYLIDSSDIKSGISNKSDRTKNRKLIVGGTLLISGFTSLFFAFD
jgi:hypothetical protein